MGGCVKAGAPSFLNIQAMRKNLLFLTVLLTCLTVSAKERTQSQMVNAAKNALYRYAGKSIQAKGKSHNLQVEEIYTDTKLKVFASEGVGAVVLCRDDNFEEVLGVAEGYTSSAVIPDGFRYWLDVTNKNIEAGRKMVAKGKVAPRDVENFLPTVWGQGKPFNNKAPKFGGVNAPIGCVATAMSQILYNYQYPTARPVFDESKDYYYSGKDKVPYSTPSGSGLFKEPTTYNWSSIITDYTGSYTTDQSKNIQYLLWDCAVSVHMKFGASGSGAMVGDVVSAASEHFGYDGLQLASLLRYFYTDAEWKDCIYHELASCNPILYGGADPDTGMGHAFVFSGMRTDGTVYVNWGWDGLFNGYYSIDYLAPNNPDAQEGDNFSDGQEMVVGFRTEKDTDGKRGVYNASLFLALNGSGAGGFQTNAAGALTFAGGFYNYNRMAFTGDIDIIFESQRTTDESFAYIIHAPEDGAIAFGYGYRGFDLSGMLQQDFGSGTAKAGKYLLYIVSKDVQEDTPQIMRSYGGELVYEVEIDRNGKVVSLEEYEGTSTAVESLRAPQSGNMTDRVFNLSGQAVGDSYKGIVIKNGKKIIQ